MSVALSVDRCCVRFLLALLLMTAWISFLPYLSDVLRNAEASSTAAGSALWAVCAVVIAVEEGVKASFDEAWVLGGRLWSRHYDEDVSLGYKYRLNEKHSTDSILCVSWGGWRDLGGPLVLHRKT